MTDIKGLGDYSTTEVLRLAAAAEQSSEHPLGAAIVNWAQKEELELPEISDFSAVIGQGIEAELEGKPILVGNQQLMRDRGLDIEPIKEELAALEEEGKTAMLVAYQQKVIGIIAVADTIKDDSPAAISAFKKLGLYL